MSTIRDNTEILVPQNCLVCDKPIENQGHVMCLRCGKPCKFKPIPKEELVDLPEGEMKGFDAISACCNADVSLDDIHSTCSEECSEKSIKNIEEKMGTHIIDRDRNGTMRLIPTRDIVLKGGLTQDELMKYPEYIPKGDA